MQKNIIFEMIPIIKWLDLIEKLAIQFNISLAEITLFVAFDQWFVIWLFKYSNLFLLDMLFDLVVNMLEEIPDDSNSMGPPYQFLVRDLAFLCKVLIKEFLYFLNAGIFGNRVYLVGRIADILDHVGKVLIQKEPFLIKVIDLKQKLDFLLEIDDTEDD